MEKTLSIREATFFSRTSNGRTQKISREKIKEGDVVKVAGEIKGKGKIANFRVINEDGSFLMQMGEKVNILA